MHERESIPASRTVPSAAEAVLSAPEIGEILDPPHVIAMQRTAGNQATTAYLAAAEPPEPPQSGLPDQGDSATPRVLAPRNFGVPSS